MSGWVRLSEVRTVRGGEPTGAVIRCGLTDLLLADLNVSVVFFFGRALDPDRLAAALSSALRRLPVFAGRVRGVEGGLEIRCDDSGVPLSVCESDATLPEAISRMTLPQSGFVEHVEAGRGRADAAPVLAVQLTRLSDGATALGCSWHHAVGDMRTFMLLMRTWSAYTEGQEPPEVVLIGDRDAHLDGVLPERDSGRPGFRLVEPAEMAGLDRAVARAPLANRAVQIHFGAREVARMRERFTAAAGRRLSTNDALAAHVVSCVRLLDRDDEARALTIPVDVRRLLGLSAGCVGNLVGEIHLECAPQPPPERLAADIRAAIDDFSNAHLSLRTSRTLLKEHGPGLLDRAVPLGFDPPNRTFMLSNWSGFGVYDTVFEGCRPVSFSPAISLPLPWVCWIVEGFEGEGYLCTLVVPSALAARLRGGAGAQALHRFREPGEEVRHGLRRAAPS